MTNERARILCKMIESNFGVVSDMDIRDMIVNLSAFDIETRKVVRDTIDMKELKQ